MSHVALYTHLIPTPPASRKLSLCSSSDSPPRGLRRIRGNIADSGGGGGAPVSSAAVAPVTPAPRRGSAHLHHPRQLRSSPKSAFFEDERRRAAAATLNGTALFAEHEPLSRPDSGGGVLLRGAGLGRVIGFDEVVRRDTELADDDDCESVAVSTDDEDEGIALEDDRDADDDARDDDGQKRERLRVVKRDGKKVTPWATRASSFVSERPDSLLDTPSTATVTTIRVADRNDDQGAVADSGLGEPAILDSPPLSPSPALSPAPVLSPAPALSPAPTPPPASAPSPAPSATPSHSSSSSGNEIFLDAVETPLVDPPSPTSPTASAPAPAPTITEEETKRVILIYSPPTDSTTPTTAPSLALIPATPLAVSSSAENEKQLGHPGCRPISRRNTGNSATGRAESIPEDDTLDTTTTPRTTTAVAVRPSITAIPEIVRGSKLHPWWRPKNESPASSVEDLALPECSRFPEDGAHPRTARSSTGGRNTKRIKGTKFVIEFVGWKRIGNAVLGKKLRGRSRTVKERGERGSENEAGGNRPKTASTAEGHGPKLRTTL